MPRLKATSPAQAASADPRCDEPGAEAPAPVIRVLHVRTVAGNGGGPEKTIFRGAAYLRALGVQAEALYLLDAQHPCESLLARAGECGMPVHVAMERSALDPSGAAAFRRRVRAGCAGAGNDDPHGERSPRRDAPRGRVGPPFDIVHAHDYKSNALARLFASTAAYRIVATAHGYNQTTSREACYYALERMLLRRCDAVICPSAQLAQQLADSGVGRRRLCVIPNGIELDHWPFHPCRRHEGPLRLLYLGRLSPEKNPAGLLQACARLRLAGRRVHLRLAGDGPQRPTLELLASSLALAEGAEFLGQREDVAGLLAWADVLVNPSLTEAMPNCVIEALAGGTPVVATDVGATAELVLHERTGLLVPPGDVDALAEAVARLADAPDLAQQLAIRGREHVQRSFDFGTRMAHEVAVYRGVLAHARKGEPGPTGGPGLAVVARRWPDDRVIPWKPQPAKRPFGILRAPSAAEGRA